MTSRIGHKRRYSIHLALSVLRNAYPGRSHQHSVGEPKLFHTERPDGEAYTKRDWGYQPMSSFRHMCEWTFRWFQLPAFKSSKPRHWGVDTCLLHCVLSKFLTHRIHENNKWVFNATEFWDSLLWSQITGTDILHENIKSHDNMCSIVPFMEKY